MHTSAYQIAEFSAPSDAEDAAQGGVAEAQRTLTTQKRVRWRGPPSRSGSSEVETSNPGRRGREAAPTSDELGGCRSTDDKYTSDIVNARLLY